MNLFFTHKDLLALIAVLTIHSIMITPVLLPKLPRTNPLNCSLGQRLVPLICSFFLIISLSPAVFGQGKLIGLALVSCH